LPNVVLSVVIPAWNETGRLPAYLGEIQSYLNRTYPDEHEVVVVDDGGADELGQVLQHRFGDWTHLQLLRLEKNQGKGAAVKVGMLAATGRRRLFADADGATPIDQEAALSAAILNGADVAVGVRIGRVDVRRTRFRGLSGRIFAYLARRLTGVAAADPQCGFKMFAADAALRLFTNAKEPRYLFDLEVFSLAARWNLVVVEAPVAWTEKPGSKMRIGDVARMAVGLFALAARLRTGRQPSVAGTRTTD
jgi:dolichyl-phosphate beta-glucosyltransferase